MAKKPSGKAKGARKPRARAKTKPDVPGAKGAAAAPGRAAPKPREDDEMRRQFLGIFRGQWANWQKQKKAAEELGRKVKVALKGSGFLVSEFVIADELETVKGEKKVSEHVGLRLRVAKWIGHGLPGEVAKQLDLFQAPPIPPEDHAYDQGKQASMENRQAKPDYPAGTPLYERYMDGYHDDQKRIGQGFKKPTNGDGGEPGDGEQEPIGDPPGDAGEPVQAEAGDRIPRSEWNKRMKELGTQDDGAPPARH